MIAAVFQVLKTVFWVALAALFVRVAFSTDAAWVSFGCGLVIVLIYHARHLRRLRAWLDSQDGRDVPGASGLWDDAFAALHRRERRHGEERQNLSRLVERYSQAARALPDGVVILDADNRVVWCNEKAEARFGISSETDAGQPITNLVRQPEFVEYLEAGDYSRPLQMRSSRGTRLILSLQIIPYDDAQKLLLARDITQAVRLETMRRDFVANVSHELRTPLTVLAGFIETIQELRLDPERARHYMGMMADQASRMQRILGDLLLLSTLESAPQPARDQRIEVKPLLDRVYADAAALSRGRHKITLAAEGEFDLLGAEGEIASAFANLVSNAVRYTPADGEIRLLWKASADGAAFTVEDSGIGIEPQHIARLTERFYRVDRGRSRDTGGTGLGLAIVKHALLRHDADLEVESEPDKCSRFTARFSARVLAARKPRSDIDA